MRSTATKLPCSTRTIKSVCCFATQSGKNKVDPLKPGSKDLRPYFVTTLPHKESLTISVCTMLFRMLHQSKQHRGDGYGCQEARKRSTNNRFLGMCWSNTLLLIRMLWVAPRNGRYGGFYNHCWVSGAKSCAHPFWSQCKTACGTWKGVQGIQLHWKGVVTVWIPNRRSTTEDYDQAYKDCNWKEASGTGSIRKWGRSASASWWKMTCTGLTTPSPTTSC